MSASRQQTKTFYVCWTEDSVDRTYPLEQNDVLIGRSSDCQIVVNSRNVSRRHARISRVGNEFRLEDLNSTHGTFVQGTRITQYTLQAGDVIELGAGNVSLVFTPQPPSTVRVGTSSLEAQLRDLNRVGAAESSELEKISWILNFQQHWEGTFTPETAFDQILLSSLKLSGAERAFILIRGAAGMTFATGMDAGRRKLPEAEFRTSRSVVGHVEQTGEPIFMVEGLQSAFAAQQSVISSGVKAIACLPLSGIPTDSGISTLLGILYLDSTKPMHALSGLDEQILRKLAGDAGNVLERIEFIKSIEQRKTLERELTLAEEMQKALLPREIPAFGQWELAAYSKPTRYVGGDFYDFVRTPEGSLLLILGDVSGKGVSAALLSAMILGSLHSSLRSQSTIADATTALNKLMCDKVPTGKFVTLFLAEFEENGNARYVSAGHTTAYIYRSRQSTIEEVPSNNLVVGAFSFAQFETAGVVLEVGDILITYSDGLTEAENARGEMLGEAAVLGAIHKSGAAGAEAALQELKDVLQRFAEGHGQTDDITIAAIGRK